ncbi:MAG TPA: protein kinase [Tahibacter sp.]|nr:protein kinase [Tahibacter sp.]
MNSLVSRLRRALADEDFRIVGNVARVGYRLGVPAHAEPIAGFAAAASPLKAGSAVPLRTDFILIEPLGTGEVEVWLARHRRTQTPRVFKFAVDGPRLSSLKREVTLARVLQQTLGERADFVQPSAWNFETAPFWIKLPYAGRNLVDWAAAQGGIAALALERRIALLADIADTVAAAHGAGVLHKDLKPTNVLIDAAGSRPRVVDFGCGTLLDPERLAELEVTRMGFTREDVGAGSAGGTALYLAPEVLAGQAPTAQADVYALGVMLYQFCTGQLLAPIAPGWQHHVDDELLREDIEAAARAIRRGAWARPRNWCCACATCRSGARRRPARTHCANARRSCNGPSPRSAHAGPGSSSRSAASRPACSSAPHCCCSRRNSARKRCTSRPSPRRRGISCATTSSAPRAPSAAPRRARSA